MISLDLRIQQTENVPGRYEVWNAANQSCSWGIVGATDISLCISASRWRDNALAFFNDWRCSSQLAKNAEKING